MYQLMYQIEIILLTILKFTKLATLMRNLNVFYLEFNIITLTGHTIKIIDYFFEVGNTFAMN